MTIAKVLTLMLMLMSGHEFSHEEIHAVQGRKLVLHRVSNHAVRS